MKSDSEKLVDAQITMFVLRWIFIMFILYWKEPDLMEGIIALLMSAAGGQ